MSFFFKLFKCVLICGLLTTFCLLLSHLDLVDLFGLLNLTGLLPLVSLLLLVGCAGRPFHPLPRKLPNGNRQPLQTFRPYNIAHRGSNGELPEETEPAYKVGNKYDIAISILFCLKGYCSDQICQILEPKSHPYSYLLELSIYEEFGNISFFFL